VAVWRELRKAGAVPISAGTWALPSDPEFQAALDRAENLSRRGGGKFAIIDAAPRGDESAAIIHDAFKAARLDEWAEFEADCGKYEAEIAKEIRNEKFTFGELEEEEQSLERLRRWHHDLMKRDALHLPEAAQAGARLRGCESLLEGYAEMVYDVMRDRAATLDVPSTGPES